MRKIIIHTETILLNGTHRQFQIELPSTAKRVTGILASVHPKTEAPLPPFSHPVPKPDIKGVRTEAGQLQLMIPEKRDTFYCENLTFPNHYELQFIPVTNPGISQNLSWWVSGTKRQFFKVDVPVETTIIEGYYKDEIQGRITDYTVKICLELTINQ